MTRQILWCAARTIGLLARRALHLHSARVGSEVVIPDGRRFEVFRESSCDRTYDGTAVMLAVWFRLRGVPAGGRLRRWLFERESIVNTFLFAGVEGYLVKLWMVNRDTSEYAGLYSWSSAELADAYGRYITAVLRPLSVPGSTGFQVVADTTLEEYLATRAASTT
jgi:hypothetical protein